LDMNHTRSNFLVNKPVSFFYIHNPKLVSSIYPSDNPYHSSMTNVDDDDDDDDERFITHKHDNKEGYKKQ
jgi:hypothetical protein